MLYPLVESCTPEDIFRVWLRNPIVISNGDTSNNVYTEKRKHFLLFLKTEIEEEIIRLVKIEFVPKLGYQSKVRKSNVKCLLCNKRHWTLMFPELPSNKMRVKTPDLEEKLDESLSNHCVAEEVLQT
ncbi:hypothetical protein TNCV_135951 [Trichonephila clavipes]|nr:hypothetical protein TNCV_135951 [Trichonephila clavipes]